MPEMTDPPEPTLDPAQAAELALLIEMEARWENLRVPRSRTAREPSTTNDLQAKQKAYDAFRGGMRAYNVRHAPAHVPELLLNTPARLGKWCRWVRKVYGLAGRDSRLPCPAHLLEKAYRSADKLAGKAGREPAVRPAPPDTMQAVLGELEALAVWCDDQATAA
jgi:hypothetical protein